MELAFVSKKERYGILATSSAIFLIFMGIAIFSKSCQSDNGFRVEHSARMGGGLDMGNTLLAYGDTAKPKLQQKITVNRYVLTGNDTLFQVLWLQCTSPSDVTPRNLQKLQTWLQTNIRQDTTTKQ